MSAAFAGQADSATIEACANYATVTGTRQNVGGIVGRLNGQVRCALDRPALRELRHDQQWYEQFLGRYRWHCLLYYAERVL